MGSRGSLSLTIFWNSVNSPRGVLDTFANLNMELLDRNFSINDQ